MQVDDRNVRDAIGKNFLASVHFDNASRDSILKFIGDDESTYTIKNVTKDGADAVTCVTITGGDAGATRDVTRDAFLERPFLLQNLKGSLLSAPVPAPTYGRVPVVDVHTPDSPSSSSDQRHGDGDEFGVDVWGGKTFVGDATLVERVDALEKLVEAQSKAATEGRKLLKGVILALARDVKTRDIRFASMLLEDQEGHSALLLGK